MKKILSMFCAFLLLLSLSGCGIADGANTDTLLSPPAPAGELNDVWEVLKASAGSDIKLKYPSSGIHRSAIIEKDLNGDGIMEAVAFYSTTLDNTTTLHISLVAKSGDEWASGGTSTIVATGIEKVEFADINGDGVFEIIVGWNIYGSVEKSLGVYSADSLGLTSRLLESYNTYICKDFDFDANPDILIVSHDTKKATSSARLFDLTESGVKEIGACDLDAAVTEYSEPIVFAVNKKTAVYIDGVKGAGTITEMLIIEENSISNLSYSPTDDSAFDTFRTGSIKTADINRDGNYDIPLSYVLTQSTDANSQSIYKTNWYNFDGKGISLALSTIMNYTDSYFLEIPEKWDSSISVSLDTATKTLTVFRLDTITGSSAEMLLKINAVPKNETLNSVYKGSELLAETQSFTYYATLGIYEGSQAITIEELKDLFNIIP